MIKVALCYHCGMSQPVKLSDALILEARLAAQEQERSIAGQVEFWAKLGRSVDFLLSGQEVTTLTRTVGTTPLSDLVETVDTPAGREKLRIYLESEPFPHFEAHPTLAGILIRTEENGERAVGRFVNSEFVIVPTRDKIGSMPPRSLGASGRAIRTGSLKKVQKKNRAALA
jgi:hypothetical protein